MGAGCQAAKGSGDWGVLMSIGVKYDEQSGFLA